MALAASPGRAVVPASPARAPPLGSPAAAAGRMAAVDDYLRGCALRSAAHQAEHDAGSLAVALRNEEELRGELAVTQQTLQGVEAQLHTLASSGAVESARRQQQQASNDMHADLVLQQMRQDIDTANAKIRALVKERRTNEAQRELLQELKQERDAVRQEALSAAREAETLKQAQAHWTDQVRLNQQQHELQEQLEKQLFAAQDARRAAEEEAAQAAAKHRQHCAVMEQQRETDRQAATDAQELQRTAERQMESLQKKHSESVQRIQDDHDKALHAAKRDVARLQEELQKAQEQAQRVRPLEEELVALRKEMADERQRHRQDRERQREDLAKSRKDADDWHAAFDTAEQHKVALTAQVRDLQQSRELWERERASLGARLEVAQEQGQRALAMEARRDGEQRQEVVRLKGALSSREQEVHALRTQISITNSMPRAGPAAPPAPLMPHAKLAQTQYEVRDSSASPLVYPRPVPAPPSPKYDVHSSPARPVVATPSRSPVRFAAPAPR